MFYNRAIINLISQQYRQWAGFRKRLFPVLTLLSTFLLGHFSMAAHADLTLINEEQLSPRLHELTFTTSALNFVPFWVSAPPKVRVLLPDNYDLNRGQHYPVLYLYHGGLSDQASWTDPLQGNAEALTADMPVIVVMPDGGPVGFYKNWFSNLLGFEPPQWETFHIDQLIPWIDANYRTVQNRSSRAVAGFSMGGFGAISYAAKHPEVFGIAASLSGALNLNNPENDIRSPAQEFLSGAIFGFYSSDEVRYRGVNPADLVPNLTKTDLSIYTGDTGVPESTYIIQDAVTVHDSLDALGVRHRFTINAGEAHTWENTRHSLTDWLPHLMSTFSRRPDPRNFTFTSIEQQYSSYGWDVQLQRDVIEFSALLVSGNRWGGKYWGGKRRGGKRRFELIGNGDAVVTTPPLGWSNRPFRVKIKDQLGTSVMTAYSNDQGRLEIPISLGSGNQFQQFSPEADALSTGPSTDDTPFATRGNGSRFFTAEVSFKRINFLHH